MRLLALHEGFRPKPTMPAIGRRVPRYRPDRRHPLRSTGGGIDPGQCGRTRGDPDDDVRRRRVLDRRTGTDGRAARATRGR